MDFDDGQRANFLQLLLGQVTTYQANQLLNLVSSLLVVLFHTHQASVGNLQL